MLDSLLKKGKVTHREDKTWLYGAAGGTAVGRDGSRKDSSADGPVSGNKRAREDNAAASSSSAASSKTKKSKKSSAKEGEAESEDEASSIAAARALFDVHGGGYNNGLGPEPKNKPSPDKTTIILFYGYVDPQFTRKQQDDALDFCKRVLTEQGCTGRLRLGREGFNGTLTGPYDGARAFVVALRDRWPMTFGPEGDCYNNFKFVDGLPASQRLKTLKVFPVTEIVTYGFDPKQAPLHMRGKHLSPPEFHKALEADNTICLDVRNFNESLIGKFVPPGDVPITGAPGVVTDMLMRRSTDFPKWVDNNRHKLEGKKVLLYCTAGVRCERASAFLRKRGIDDVSQLQGGVHRYLEYFKEDGGHWKGKNYTFDKRYAHGAENATIISSCVHCGEPWERYQAGAKCAKCKMEVLFCRRCQRTPKPIKKHLLYCPLCKPGGNRAGPQPLPKTKSKERTKSQ